MATPAQVEVTTPAEGPASFAALPVTLVAASVAFVLVALSGRYGWHRDELYFRVAGQHLAWGYVDQPPFTPLLARLAERISPRNLLALRAFPALASAATVVMGALLARELGGRRRAQVAAAGAVAAGGFVLGVGHVLSTATFDLLAWLALLTIFCRLLRTGDPRWWLAYGVGAGIALLNKNLAVLLSVSLLGSLLLGGRRDLLDWRWLAAGGAAAVVLAGPHLWWQAHNHWPQFAMAAALSQRLGTENRLTILPFQLVLLGPFLARPLWHGVGRLRASPTLRPLLWAWPLGLGLGLLSAGRPYYVLPLTIAVMVAGCVALDEAGQNSSLWAVIVAEACASVVLALPVVPVRALRTGIIPAVNQAAVETVGWTQLVDQLAGVAGRLDTGDRSHLMILAATYGEAGAIDLYGPPRGLPLSFSPHNSYPYFRQPHDDAAVVVTVRLTHHWLDRWFSSCIDAGSVDNGLGITNEVQGQPIMICRGLKQPWSVTWPQMRFLA